MVIPIEYFSKQERRGIVQVLIEFLPESHIDVTDSVYSQPVKTVFGDNFISYPVKKDFFDLFAFCVEVGKTEKSAFLYSISIILLVVFICNVTRVMIVWRFVEWNDLWKVIILNISNMIEDDIYHY